MIKNSVLLFLAKSDFSEEEYRTIKSILDSKRFKIFVTSDASEYCIGLSGLKVKNDVSILNVNPNNFSAIIIIGGNGIRKYSEHLSLQKIIQNFYSKKKVIGAICAAPLILATSGVLKNHSATCFPLNKMELIKNGIDFKDNGVVIDRNIVTASDSSQSLNFINSIIMILNSK